MQESKKLPTCEDNDGGDVQTIRMVFLDKQKATVSRMNPMCHCFAGFCSEKRSGEMTRKDKTIDKKRIERIKQKGYRKMYLLLYSSLLLYISTRFYSVFSYVYFYSLISISTPFSLLLPSMTFFIF